MLDLKAGVEDDAPHPVNRLPERTLTRNRAKRLSEKLLLPAFFHCAFLEIPMKKILSLLVVLALFALNAIAAVNINTANQAQLESLNGIGPVKAKAIIDYRAKNGPFKTVEDLEKVDGIGPGTLDKIKADVSVSGETKVKAEAKPTDKKESKEESKAAKKDMKADEKKSEKDAKKAAKDEKKSGKESKKDTKEEVKADKKDTKADNKKSDKKADEKKAPKEEKK